MTQLTQDELNILKRHEILSKQPEKYFEKILHELSQWGLDMCTEQKLDYKTFMLGATNGILMMNSLATGKPPKYKDSLEDKKENT